MQKNALVLHGWYGHNKENWFPWIKKELEGKGYKVNIPNLPNSKYPDYETDIKFIKKYIENLNDGDVIIGHSLGCSLTLNAIQKYRLKNLNVFIVAPPILETLKMSQDILDDSYEGLKKFCENNNFNNIDKSNKIEAFISKDDPYCDFKTIKEYLENLGAIRKINIYEDKGHFNESAGITEFNELLDLIK